MVSTKITVETVPQTGSIKQVWKKKLGFWRKARDVEDEIDTIVATSGSDIEIVSVRVQFFSVERGGFSRACSQ